MKAYSSDLRAKIIERCEAGHSQREVADQFGVSVITVHRYWKRYRKSGQAYCKPVGGYRKSVIEPHREQIIEWIQEDGSITLSELQHKLREECAVDIALSGLCRHLKLMGWTRKKNAAGQRTKSC